MHLRSALNSCYNLAGETALLFYFCGTFFLKFTWNPSSFFIILDEFSSLCGSQRPGYFIDIFTGLPVGEQHSINKFYF